MKLAIVGSHKYFNYEFVKNTINNRYNLNDIDLIISGGATGIDDHAKQFAIDYDIPILTYYAAWKKYGNAAGPIRNEKIVKSCDELIAFWNYTSPGTKNAINHAKKYNKKCTIIDIRNTDLYYLRKR